LCRRVAKKKFKDDPTAGEQFTATAMANLSFLTRCLSPPSPPSLPSRPDSALGTADLIVEAITENLPLKQKLFSEWDKVRPSPIPTGHGFQPIAYTTDSPRLFPLQCTVRLVPSAHLGSMTRAEFHDWG
jgi:hypothetical protein